MNYGLAQLSVRAGHKKGRLRDLKTAGKSSENHLRLFSLYETPSKAKHLRRENMGIKK